MPNALFRIFRGADGAGELKDYSADVTEGMVVLDVVHQIQADQANDLAVRWNCKAGKCGSCSAEINGKPRLMCMTRCNELDRAPDAPDGTWRMQQADIDRVQEFRKCIECFLCQDVCHVLRDHQKHETFVGPRFLTYVAALEMHPLDTVDRTEELKEADGIGYCNITKCCSTVCPESIAITDNAIIPLKERVADRFYDPLKALVRLVRNKSSKPVA
jgi:succinate dehydrogenase / fumarate reductase iron-sulfur subunit